MIWGGAGPGFRPGARPSVVRARQKAGFLLDFPTFPGILSESLTGRPFDTGGWDCYNKRGVWRGQSFARYHALLFIFTPAAGRSNPEQRRST